MSRMGDELIMELAAQLGGFNKCAAKKDDDDKDEKKKDEKKEDKKCAECGKKDCGCGCDGDTDKCKCKAKDKDDKKDKKDDKKKDAVLSVLNGLSKLAGELDEIGAEEASSLVDDALKVIVNNLEEDQE